MKTTTPHANAQHKDLPVFGMLLGLSAFFLLALMQLFAKLLGEAEYHTIEITFFRNAIGFAGMGTWLLLSRKTSLTRTKRPLAHLTRGIIGTIGLLLTFSAFHLMPLSETTVFLFTTSLIMPVMGILFLNERIGIYRWSAILVGFFGVALMAEPSGQITLEGAAIALAAALTQAVIGICLRSLGKTEHPFTVVFYFLLIGSAGTAFLLPLVWETPEAADLWMIAGVAISGTFAQIALTMAFKYASPAQVAPMNYTGLIWALLFDLIVWSYVPGWPVIAGGIIVVASNLFILFRERKKQETLLKHQTVA